eukprot:7476973-Pyramimonas_sp.AAC.1
MQQTHAPDDAESIDVRTSSVALLHVELSAENRQHPSASALWVAKSLCMLSPVVARWRERGFGVRLSFEASELLVNHWLWTDNVILDAST